MNHIEAMQIMRAIVPEYCLQNYGVHIPCNAPEVPDGLTIWEKADWSNNAADIVIRFAEERP